MSNHTVSTDVKAGLAKCQKQRERCMRVNSTQPSQTKPDVLTSGGSLWIYVFDSERLNWPDSGDHLSPLAVMMQMQSNLRINVNEELYEHKPVFVRRRPLDEGGVKEEHAQSQPRIFGITLEAVIKAA